MVLSFLHPLHLCTAPCRVNMQAAHDSLGLRAVPG
ncbi:hypothetical protein SAMN06265378_11177 [Paracoccus sediminis]|uniref:Uncharacterized protein n=1 Tax=Paracoccus sediminis TaxID=1214787 RepID=A0A238XPC1_9RHOB|nr:hypothetical protein SAMN06265378_11177 [Paracoccus sediminis]